MEGAKRELYSVKKPEDAVGLPLPLPLPSSSSSTDVTPLHPCTNRAAYTTLCHTHPSPLTPSHPAAAQPSEPIMDIPPELEDQYRLIQYQFPAEFLKAKTIGTSLVFSVGNNEVGTTSPLDCTLLRFQRAASLDLHARCLCA